MTARYCPWCGYPQELEQRPDPVVCAHPANERCADCVREDELHDALGPFPSDGAS